MADDLVLDAERIVLGSMMLEPSVIDGITARLRSTDFADLRHGSIFAAITANHARGAETGPVGIAITLNAVKELQRVGGAAHLHDLIAAVPTTANAGWYATVVADAAVTRIAAADAARLGQVVESGDAAKISAEKARLIEQWTAGIPAAVASDAGRELDAFLGVEPEPHDWLVPDLLERQDRLILTGAEGGGKSTLLRQVGVQLASGIHPFAGNDFEPLRVLLLDLENSARQVRRKLASVRAAAGRRYGGGMVVEIRTEGLDLLTREHGDWLLGLVARHRPDVLITGPAYKMAGGDPTEEGPARVVASYFDRLRTEHGCAILLEAHTPHGTNGGKRPMRPYGASLWLRWPEFGLFLTPNGGLLHWRGPRDERDWPGMLQRGGEWPWTPVARDRDQLWARICEVRATAGRPLSQRELVEKTGASKTTIARVLEEHRAEWESHNGRSDDPALWEDE